MSETKTRAIILVPLVVFTVVVAFFMLGYLVTIAFEIPQRLNFPLPIRLIGLLTLLSSFVFFGWLFRYRKPVDIIVSTYVTFTKVRRRVRLEERLCRTELLVVKGPYRYVRHPLYSGVVLLVVGWWLLLDYSFLLVSTILLLWFNFAVAPFEEKELKAIFGEDYERYAKEVPKIIPLPKRRQVEATGKRAVQKS
jgi:protein-S-isoprenylcysteine O-methyltransferase Ste14